MRRKVSELQTIITVVFVSSMLISNIIVSRQIQLPFFNITGAILIFPITYILSDLFSEVYGYRWSRISCYLAFTLNLVMSVIFQIVINCPAPDFFTEQAEAYKVVLGSTPRILGASLIAYFIGDWVNDIIFAKMKVGHKGMKGFSKRAIISSVFGELIDSLIFYPLAFLGGMPINTMINLILTQTALKLLYEIIVLPLTVIITKKTLLFENGTKEE